MCLSPDRFRDKLGECNVKPRLPAKVCKAVALTRWADLHATSGCPTCTAAVFSVDGRPCDAARMNGSEMAAIVRTFTADDRSLYYTASREGMKA